MRYEQFNKSFFVNNRKKYLDQVIDGSVSIFASNDILPSNIDGSYGFIQNSTFFYLTGIDQEDCFLILVKGEGEWLFIKETSELIKIWDGEKLSKEQATEVSGIVEIHWLEDFWEMLGAKVVDKKEVYIHRDTIQMSRFSTFRSKGKWLFDKFLEKYPLIEILNNERVINPIRMLKEEEELLAIKKAIEITHKGFKRAAKALKPGIFEFEIEAEIMHEFMMNRSRFHAFQPIIASGANACVLHYIENNKQCNDGELVLIDFGAEYANYKADITRVLPVNGKFTDRQAEVYTSVLNVMKEVTKFMQSGNTVLNLKKETSEIISKEIVNLGLVTAVEIEKNPEIVNKYFPHGVSHSLGIDVHDVGEKSTLLRAGMVLTVEPGIYIREEGIGIRLENDILITESGNINLTKHIPIEIEDIEKLMR